MRATVIRFTALALSCLLTTAFIPACGPGGCRPSHIVSLGEVTVTSYQAVVEQTDGAPHITADGTDLRETDERVCALSRDLLFFGDGPAQWGDMVWLYIPGEPELSGAWVVRDTLAAEIYREGKMVPIEQHVDLLVSTIGKWRGRALLISRGPEHKSVHEMQTRKAPRRILSRQKVDRWQDVTL